MAALSAVGGKIASVYPFQRDRCILQAGLAPRQALPEGIRGGIWPTPPEALNLVPSFIAV